MSTSKAHQAAVRRMEQTYGLVAGDDMEQLQDLLTDVLHLVAHNCGDDWQLILNSALSNFDREFTNPDDYSNDPFYDTLYIIKESN